LSSVTKESLDGDETIKCVFQANQTGYSLIIFFSIEKDLKPIEMRDLDKDGRISNIVKVTKSAVVKDNGGNPRTVIAGAVKTAYGRGNVFLRTTVDLDVASIKFDQPYDDAYFTPVLSKDEIVRDVDLMKASRSNFREFKIKRAN
jgi:hypothetical protein